MGRNVRRQAGGTAVSGEDGKQEKYRYDGRQEGRQEGRNLKIKGKKTRRKAGRK